MLLYRSVYESRFILVPAASKNSMEAEATLDGAAAWTLRQRIACMEGRLL